MHSEESPRFSLWTEHTERGEARRDGFADRNEAILSAKKYWLTANGLFRSFVRDAANADAVIFERVRESALTQVVRETFDSGQARSV